MKNIIVILALISILLISGCVKQFLAQELTFETISKGHYSGHDDKKVYVIKGTSEWNNLWSIVCSRIMPKPDLPDVNFNNEMIIAVFQGNCSTSGYSIKVTKIIEKENFVEVFVKETSPSPGSLQFYYNTQPYHIVKIKRVDKEVIFSKE
jgi:hypothetical protein